VEVLSVGKARISEGEFLESRVLTLEGRYIYARYYKEIAGASGSIVADTEIGTGAIFVTNSFGDGYDAYISEAGADGAPTGELAFDTIGNPLTIDPTTGFILTGSPTGSSADYTLSGTPADPSVCIVFAYRQQLKDFNGSKSLGDYVIKQELDVGNLLGTSNQTVVTDNGDNTVTISLHSDILNKLVTNGDSHDHNGGDGAQIDHGSQGGLTDDDHTHYLLASGTRGLSGNWDIGAGNYIALDELRARSGGDLTLKDSAGTSYLSILNTAGVALPLTGILKGNSITGAVSAVTGTGNLVARWTNANTLGIGIIYDTGTKVGVNAPTPGGYLQVFADLSNYATSNPKASTSHQLVIQGNGNVGGTASIGFQMNTNATPGDLIGAVIAGVDTGAANSGELVFYTGGAILYESLRLTSNLNTLIGAATAGASATKTLNIKNGVPNTTQIADQITIQSQDSSDSKATLSLVTEQDVESVGTFTASHKYKIILNETEYWIQLDAV
jgi:hypothetical protein